MSVLERISADAFTALVSSADFDCLPRRYQAMEFARFLVAQKVTRFTAADVSELFRAAGMSSARSARSIRCSAVQAAEYVRRGIAEGQLTLREVSPEEFEV